MSDFVISDLNFQRWTAGLALRVTVGWRKLTQRCPHVARMITAARSPRAQLQPCIIYSTVRSETLSMKLSMRIN